jgi:hypothetical protein
MKITNEWGVANQLVIRTKTGKFFQSYNSMVAFIPKKGKIKLDEKFWNYSATTSKYRNKFLGEDTLETQKKIDKGEYKLVDLNA